jgi:hypothetical protein
VIRVYRDLGDALWTRFNEGKARRLWFYRSLAEAFREAGASGTLFDEDERQVAELNRLAGST